MCLNSINSFLLLVSGTLELKFKHPGNFLNSCLDINVDGNRTFSRRPDDE